MSVVIKKAIEASFFELLAKEKPEKISVKMITDNCGVNRNSFYYYYMDISSLLDEILIKEQERVLALNAACTDRSTAYHNAMEFIYANRAVIISLSNSLFRPQLDSFIHTIMGELVYGILRRERSNADELTLRRIADFYKHAIEGMLLVELSSCNYSAPDELAEDLVIVSEKLAELFDKKD